MKGYVFGVAAATAGMLLWWWIVGMALRELIPGGLAW